MSSYSCFRRSFNFNRIKLIRKNCFSKSILRNIHVQNASSCYVKVQGFDRKVVDNEASNIKRRNQSRYYCQSIIKVESIEVKPVSKAIKTMEGKILVPKCHLPSYFKMRGENFRILSLDGGGLRGIVTAVLLARITEIYPNFMTEKIDLIAGTSGGGILALLLAHGMTPQDLLYILRHKGKEFVASTFLRKCNIFKSKYSGSTKERFLKEILGDTKMLDLQKLVMVSAVDLMCSKHNLSYGTLSEERRGWQPVVFTNLPYDIKRDTNSIVPDNKTLIDRNIYHQLNIHNDCYVYEAAMRTSAAPSFYPIYQGYCDGGIISKDPSMFAVSKVVEHYPDIDVNNITLLSLGAGTQVPHLPDAVGNVKRIEWGLAQWSQHIINLLVYSGMATSGEMLSSMLRSKYHRVDPIMQKFIPFDASDRIEELEELALKESLEKTFDFVDRYFYENIAPTLMEDSKVAKLETFKVKRRKSCNNFKEQLTANSMRVKTQKKKQFSIPIESNSRTLNLETIQ